MANPESSETRRRAERRAYRGPRLRAYGCILSLTAGGSGPMAEGMAMVALMRQKT